MQEFFDATKNRYYYYDEKTKKSAWNVPGSTWEKYKDAETRQIYFYNKETLESTWDTPAELAHSPWAIEKARPPPSPTPPKALPKSTPSRPATSKDQGRFGAGPTYPLPTYPLPPPLSPKRPGSPSLPTPPSTPPPAPSSPISRHGSDPSSPTKIAAFNFPLSSPASRALGSSSTSRTPAPAIDPEDDPDQDVYIGERPGAAEPSEFHSVTEEGETRETKEKQGYLWKKSPSGLRGFRIWQKRYFVIGRKTLTYYQKKGEKKATGLIALLDISRCDYLPKKRMGDRIDIRVKRTKRIYSLHAATAEEAKEWHAAINAAVKRVNDGDGDDPTPGAGGPSQEIDLPKSPLLLLFAKARFGKGIQQDLKDPTQTTQKMLSEIKAGMSEFLSEKYALQWLLDNTLHPTKGAWLWDTRTDKEVREEEEKKRDSELRESKASDRFCSVADCHTIPLSPKHEKCVIHSNIRVSSSTMTTDDRLVEMLKSPEFFRHLQRVFFENSDEEAHGLAIRVLWILYYGMYDRKEAAAQFYQSVSVFCEGPRFNLEIAHALILILLSDLKNEVDEKEELRVSFYNPVLNETAWKSLFASMVSSDFGIRKTALEDITTLLHDNLDNCRSLERGEKWQDWIFNLLPDIPKLKYNNDEKIKTAYAYCINVLTMVHYEEFLKSDSDHFLKVLTGTIHALHNFGGSTMEGVQVASTLLASLFSKLTSNKKLFSLSDFSSFEWKNFRVIQNFCKKFIFKTAWWNRELLLLSAAAEEEDAKAPLTPIATRDSSLTIRVPKKAPISDVKTILPRNRNKILRGMDDPTPDQKDWGLHWNEEGTCTDLILIERILNLFKALEQNVYDPVLKPTMGDDEKKFLQKSTQQYAFWEDAKTLCSTIKLADIEEHRTTHRRVSHWVREFVEKSRDRGAIIKEIKRALGGAPSSPTHSSSTAMSSPPRMVLS